MKEQDSAPDLLGDKLDEMQRLWAEIQLNWEERSKLLAQCRDLQLFKRDVRLAENTLNKQDHVLSSMQVRGVYIRV